MKMADAFRRPSRIQSHGIWHVCSDLLRTLAVVQRAARARIEGAFRPVRRFGRARNLRCNFRPRAEAGIEQSLRIELFQRTAISFKALRLSQHRFLPCESKPVQIVVDRSLKLRAAAAVI